MTATVPLEALQRERSRRLELEQFLRWEDALFANRDLSTSQRLVARATRRAVLDGKAREDGMTYISMEKIARRAGISISTASRGQRDLAHLGVIERKVEETSNREGEQRTHIFVKLTDLLNTPAKISREKPRNHGGRRERCPSCGSDHLKLVQRVICCDCGTVVKQQEKMLHQEASDEQEAFRSEEDDQGANDEMPGDQADQIDPGEQVARQETIEKQVAEQERLLSVNVTDMVVLQSNVTDKNDVQKPSNPLERAGTSQSAPIQRDPITDAAQLLLEIAGPSTEHVEMSKTGPAKYYTVHRRLTLEDMIAHLQGKKTVGALLHHPDGKARALCYDADEEEGWQHLKDAARLLPYGDYCPLLEVSPAGRGGHLWIIYSDLVDAKSAQRHLLQYAPMLSQMKELWPGPGSNKVRLPGGRYVSPKVSAWCTLTDWRGALLAPQGQAAQVLLDAQVPAELVPEYPPEPEPPSTPKKQPQEQDAAPPTLTPNQTERDDLWQTKYGGKSLWFHFTPAQLAEWYNTHHDVREILPPERNKMGRAVWRGERTASVGYTKDGEGWVDFGASALRSDGKRDGGDALELQARLTQEPKAEVMRQAARELLWDARTAMESAARNNEQLPGWVEQMMTPAGWSHYWNVRKGLQSTCTQACKNVESLSEALGESEPGGDSATSCNPCHDQVMKHTHPQAGAAVSGNTSPAGGLPGFSPCQETDQAGKTLPPDLAERGLTPGKPCEKCSCELYRDMAGYTVCVRCYPPRGYHQYSSQVDALYPRKRLLTGAWKTEAQQDRRR